MLEPQILLSQRALLDNFRALHALAQGAALAPVIKANAYGHGSGLVALALEAEFSEKDLPFFCVARVGEARELRKAGLRRPVLVLSHFNEEDFNHWPEETSVAVHDLADFHRLPKAAAQGLRSYHLNLNSGMNRLGLATENLDVEALVRAMQTVALPCEGISSHLARGEEDPQECSAAQEEKFLRALASLEHKFQSGALARPRYFHLANSPGLLTGVGLKAPLNVVRPGLHLWGVPASRATQSLKSYASTLKIAPVLSVRAPLRQVFTVKKGEGVGYGHRFVAPENALIGTICLGYADGIPRSLSRTAQEKWTVGFVVEGERVPIAGTVSMDLCMVDLSQHSRAAEWRKKVSQGSELELEAYWIGEGQRVEEIARELKTIPYEIFCRLHYRLARKMVQK